MATRAETYNPDPRHAERFRRKRLDPPPAMALQFSCGDVAPGCRRAFTGTDDDAILATVALHAQGDHGLTEIPVALAEQVRSHIAVA